MIAGAGTAARTDILPADAMSYEVSHLRALESEAIHIMREVVAEGNAIPPELMAGLEHYFGLLATQRDPQEADSRLWPWCRVTVGLKVSLQISRMAESVVTSSSLIIWL